MDLNPMCFLTLKNGTFHTNILEELIVKDYNFVISHKLEMIAILYENINITKNTKFSKVGSKYKLFTVSNSL